MCEIFGKVLSTTTSLICILAYQACCQPSVAVVFTDDEFMLQIWVTLKPFIQDGLIKSGQMKYAQGQWRMSGRAFGLYYKSFRNVRKPSLDYIILKYVPCSGFNSKNNTSGKVKIWIQLCFILKAILVTTERGKLWKNYFSLIWTNFNLIEFWEMVIFCQVTCDWLFV